MSKANLLNLNRSCGLLSALLGASLYLGQPTQLAAALITKADISAPLAQGASWVGGVAPGSADTALFDSTFSAANNSAELGTNLTWLGIALSNNMAAAYTVMATGTNALLLAGGGINMTNANADLTINAPLIVGANQFWDLNAGRTLTINGNFRTQGGAPGNGSASRGLGGINGGGSATINFNGNFTNSNGEFGPLQNYDYVVNFNPGANGSVMNNQKLTVGKFNNANVTVNFLSGTNSVSPNNYVVLGDGNTSAAGLNSGISTGTLNILGGQTTITNNSYPFVVGVVGKGTVNVNQAVLVMGGNQQIRLGGNSTASSLIAPTGTLNITNGGTAIITPSTAQSVVLGAIPTGTGTVNIYANSTLVCGRLMYSLGTGYVNFYGGTVRVPSGGGALSGGVLFQNNLTRVMIGEGGATIDDGGANVLINAPLQHDSSIATDGGLTKLGAGTLAFNFDPTAVGAGLYNGNTVVAAGTLKLPAIGLNWSAFTVNSGATLTVWPLNATTLALGDAAVLTTLTLNSGSTLTLDEGVPTFVPAANTPLVYVSGALTTAGTVTVNITNAVFNTPGQYQLINYGMFGGSIAGAGLSAFKLGTVPSSPGFAFSLINNTDTGTIDLVVSAVQTLVWDGTVNNVWDIGSPANWQGGQSYVEVGGQGPLVTFDDTLAGVQNTDILLNTTVHPGGVLFNNLNYGYTLTGSGGIAGTNTLFVSGGGRVTLANANPTSGGVQILSGTLQLGDGATHNGSVGGSITLANNGTLVLANPVNQTLTNRISGIGNFVLNSSQPLVLAASNDFSRVAITVNGGNLSNSIAGALTVGSLALGGTVGSPDVLAFSGTTNTPLTILQDSIITAPEMRFLAGAPANVYLNFGTHTSLAFSNQYVTLDTSANSIQNWNGDAAQFNTYGGLSVSNTILMNGLTWNANLGTNTATIGKLVIGKTDNMPAMVNLNSGSLSAIGQPYMGVGDTVNPVPSGAASSGVLNINGGQAKMGATTRFLIGNGGRGEINVSAGQLNFLGNGSSIMLGGDTQYAHNGATGILTISGTGSVTVSNGSGGLRLGATASGATGVTGTLQLFGGTLTTWAPITYAGTNQADSSGYVVFSGGTLRAGTNQAAFLQGLTAVTVSTNGAIIDDGGYVITVGQSLVTDSALTGTDGGLVKLGTGTLVLTNSSTYTGNTLVSQGTLEMDGVLTASPVTVQSGATLSGTGSLGQMVTINAGATLAPGTNAPGTLTISGNLALNGNLLIAVNKSLATSNSTVLVSGSLSNGGFGTITVTNFGPELVAGDTFALFDHPVLNGNHLTIAASGNVVWDNQLAVNGTIRVLSVTPAVNPLPGVIQTTFSAGQLNLAWPTNQGWILQAQTNHGTTGLGSNWYPVAGSESLTNLILTPDAAAASVFYRLARPQ